MSCIWVVGRNLWKNIWPLSSCGSQPLKSLSWTFPPRLLTLLHLLSSFSRFFRCLLSFSGGFSSLETWGSSSKSECLLNDEGLIVSVVFLLLQLSVRLGSFSLWRLWLIFSSACSLVEVSSSFCVRPSNSWQKMFCPLLSFFLCSAWNYLLFSASSCCWQPVFSLQIGSHCQVILSLFGDVLYFCYFASHLCSVFLLLFDQLTEQKCQRSLQSPGQGSTPQAEQMKHKNETMVSSDTKTYIQYKCVSQDLRTLKGTLLNDTYRDFKAPRTMRVE